MIFDVQAQDLRLHKGGAVVPCERIEAANSHLIKNMKCNLKFRSTSVAVHTCTILERSSVYKSIHLLMTFLEHSMNVSHHDSQYRIPDMIQVIREETFVSDFLN